MKIRRLPVPRHWNRPSRSRIQADQHRPQPVIRIIPGQVEGVCHFRIGEGNHFRLQHDRTILAETRHHADQVAVVRGRWKLIHDRQREQFILFDLDRDPAERVNLLARRPRISRSLRDILSAYEKRPGRKPDAQPVGDELREELESLGYLERGKPDDSQPTTPTSERMPPKRGRAAEQTHP